jgi:hypothetical protein
MKRICGVKAMGLFGTAFGVLLPGLLATSALGQTNTFDIVVSNVVGPEQPSATVEVWAAFDPNAYAFCRAAFNVTADADPGAFSAPEGMLKGPGSKDGEVVADGDSVLDIMDWQWACHPIYADTANPMLIWRATWSTADFSPRSIGLDTGTLVYDLYPWGHCEGESFLDEFIEGSGLIQVVPAPASAALLLVGPLGTIALRRRR